MSAGRGVIMAQLTGVTSVGPPICRRRHYPTCQARRTHACLVGLEHLMPPRVFLRGLHGCTLLGIVTDLPDPVAWCGSGRLKASRPLIRVLVINDNIYGLTIS